MFSSLTAAFLLINLFAFYSFHLLSCRNWMWQFKFNLCQTTENGYIDIRQLGDGIRQNVNQICKLASNWQSLLLSKLISINAIQSSFKKQVYTTSNIIFHLPFIDYHNWHFVVPYLKLTWLNKPHNKSSNNLLTIVLISWQKLCSSDW